MHWAIPILIEIESIHVTSTDSMMLKQTESQKQMTIVKQKRTVIMLLIHLKWMLQSNCYLSKKQSNLGTGMLRSDGLGKGMHREHNPNLYPKFLMKRIVDSILRQKWKV
jgi:hypothetical protein